MRRESVALAGLMLTAVSALAADERMVQAHRQGGVEGVVSLAEALAKDEGGSAAVEALTSVLEDGNWRLRAAALHALGEMGDTGRRAWREVAAAITADDGLEVSELLKELGAGDIPIWLAEAALEPDDDSEAYFALSEVGIEYDRIVPILQKGLRHSDLDVQWRAAVLLGDMGAKAAPAREALAALLKEEPTREKGPGDYFSPNDIRAKAAYALGRIGAEPDETVTLLTAMLKHPDPEIRIWSALGLGEMGDRAQAAVPALIDRLTDEQMILRPGGCIYSAHPDHCAATALVGIGPPALPAIIAALNAEQAVVRQRMADALWYVGSERAQPAVKALFQRLHDPDAAVRRTAVYVLGWIAPLDESLVPEIVPMIRDADPTVRNEAFATLGRVEQQEAIPLEALLPLLDDPDSDVRGNVLALLEHRVPSTVLEPAIRGLLKASQPSARTSAAQALSHIGREATWAAPALVELLKDEDSMVRYAAVEALQEIKPEAATVSSALVELLKDDRANVRSAAAEVLGGIGPAADVATTALVGLLNDDGEYVRMAAVRALGRIGPAEKVMPALIKMLDDPDARCDAVEAIGRLGPDAAASFSTLTELLQDEDASMRVATITALRNIGPPKAVVPVLMESLEDKEPDCRSAAIECLGEIGPAAAISLPALLVLLRDDDPDVGDRAAIAIAEIGPATTTVPLLTRLVKDGDSRVRHAAIEGLGIIGPAAADACPALIESLKDKDPLIQTAAAAGLGRMGAVASTAVPSLVELLTVDDPTVKLTSVYALGEIGPEARTAIPAITQLAEQKTDVLLRDAAAEALRKITKDESPRPERD